MGGTTSKDCPPRVLDAKVVRSLPNVSHLSPGARAPSAHTVCVLQLVTDESVGEVVAPPGSLDLRADDLCHSVRAALLSQCHVDMSARRLRQMRHRRAATSRRKTGIKSSCGVPFDPLVAYNLSPYANGVRSDTVTCRCLPCARQLRQILHARCALHSVLRLNHRRQCAH